MIRPGLYIAYGTRGRGVFTGLSIPAGEVIEVAPSIEVTNVSGMADYIYQGSTSELSRVVFGYGMLYAHSSEPNIRPDHAATCTIFIALRDIAAGEELTQDYGYDWWKTREIEPR